MNNQFQDYLKNPNEHSPFLSEITLDEVVKVLKYFDAQKSVICMAYQTISTNTGHILAVSCM